MKSKLSETQIQQHLVKLLNAFGRSDIEWHAVPNGEQRTKKTAARLKSLGVQAGVADLMFLVDGNPIALELKTPTGKQSKAQEAFQERFERAGGTYFLAQGLERALAVLIGLPAFRENVHVNVPTLMNSSKA